MNKIVRYEKTILAEAEDDSPRAKTTSLKKSLFHRDSLLARQRENVLQSVEHHTLNPSSFRRNLSQNDPFDKSKTLDLLFVPDKSKDLKVRGRSIIFSKSLSKYRQKWRNWSFHLLKTVEPSKQGLLAK